MVLYLTWGVETTLESPSAVPELFLCGLTGLFNTRQLQCGLNKKTVFILFNRFALRSLNTFQLLSYTDVPKYNIYQI